MAPPRIMFDDGSRIIQDSSTSPERHETSPSARGTIPIETYYEITRTAKEAVNKLDWSNSFRGKLLRSEGFSDKDDDGFICRVALQFPDELLADASQVSWLMEEVVASAYRAKFMSFRKKKEMTPHMLEHLENPPLVFILGDSTYGSCCPDEVAAQHLNADVLIHYGYACLSSSNERIPVVYAFGVASLGSEGDSFEDANKQKMQSCWSECANLVSEQIKSSMEGADKEHTEKLLILFDVKYHHAINGLQQQLMALNCISSLIMGTIPEQRLKPTDAKPEFASGCCSSMADCNRTQCCGNETGGCNNMSDCNNTQCCQNETETPGSSSVTPCCRSSNEIDQEIKLNMHCTSKGGSDELEASKNMESCKINIPRSIGGLEIPDNLDLSKYTLLYVGDDFNIDSSNGNHNHNTRLLHILLRCNASDGCKFIWSYSPMTQSLNCDLLNSPISPSDSTTFSTFLSRTLRRRYFLIQKAKMATTIGILIGTTTTSTSFRLLLERIRSRIQSTGRTAYTFAVGKLASASSKVSNFAEIDCFVLIACQESIAKFWRMERDEMIVPVITPLELDVALGLREWDGRYSCDFGDLIRWDLDDGVDNKVDVADIAGENGDNDQPFFSMISGRYENSRVPKHDAPANLQDLPGQGQIMEYRSEAAEFLKQREYQGLESNIGQTVAKAAVAGKAGIASNYGEEL